ncbi:hypothetical protein ACLB2K_039804 [Fragaria x ananassa]
MAVWALKPLFGYHRVHAKPGVESKKRKMKWCCPSGGWLKVNIAQAMQMEAEALRAGMLIGIHQQWSEGESEGDSNIVLAALPREGDDLSEVDDN